jgi:hypothetical protein
VVIQRLEHLPNRLASTLARVHLKSPFNPRGRLSINDLEAATFVLQFLVLEQ